MNRLKLLGSCGSRVTCIAGDEHGNVAAIGKNILAFRPKSFMPEVRPYDIYPIKVLVDDAFPWVDQSDSRAHLVLNAQRVELPGIDFEAYSAAFDPISRTIYIITRTSLLSVPLSGGSAAIMADNSEGNEEYPHYECVAAAFGYVVAYRYGLTLWSGDERIVLDGAPYSDVVVASKKSIYAMHHDVTEIQQRRMHETRGTIRLFDRYGKVRREVDSPDGRVNFCDCVDGRLITISRRSEERVGKSLTGSVLERDELRTVELSDIGADGFARIESTGQVAVGNLTGEILLWNTYDDAIQQFRLADPESIFELFWSASHNSLFVGTKSGNVYALEVP